MLIFHFCDRIALYTPVYSFINLFIHILRDPTASTIQSDLVLLDIAFGYFSNLEFATDLELSLPFVRELCHYARLVGARGKDNNSNNSTSVQQNKDQQQPQHGRLRQFEDDNNNNSGNAVGSNRADLAANRSHLLDNTNLLSGSDNIVFDGEAETPSYLVSYSTQNHDGIYLYSYTFCLLSQDNEFLGWPADDNLEMWSTLLPFMETSDSVF